MFIQTEATPNPNTLKFLPGREVMASGTAFFTSAKEAAPSPLAAALFKIEGVAAVFLGADFITVSRAEGVEWETLKAPLLSAVMDHFVTGKPVIGDVEMWRKGDAEKENSASGDPALVAQIKELIETRVRPAVAQDGGDIIFRGFEDGIVKLELHGACSGCPSSTMTLKNGIENMLKHYVPEVVAVEAVA